MNSDKSCEKRSVLSSMSNGGIMFHLFHDSHTHKPGQGSISAEQFQVILEKIGLDCILPAHEWALRAQNGSLKRGDVCLTFDDGLMCQYDIALPVMRKHGLTAFWFVNSFHLVGELKLGQMEIFRRFRNEHFSSIDDFYTEFFPMALSSVYKAAVKRGMDSFPKDYLSEFKFYSEEDRKYRYLRDKVLKTAQFNQIMHQLMKEKNVTPEELTKDLWLANNHLRVLEKEEHIIGLHSHSHPISMEKLPVEKQRQEYKKNYNIFCGILKQKPFAMAHPCNSYSKETLNILSDLGISLGFRSNAEKKKYNLLELPRKDAVSFLVA